MKKNKKLSLTDTLTEKSISLISTPTEKSLPLDNTLVEKVLSLNDTLKNKSLPLINTLAENFFVSPISWWDPRVVNAIIWKVAWHDMTHLYDISLVIIHTISLSWLDISASSPGLTSKVGIPLPYLCFILKPNIPHSILNPQTPFCSTNKKGMT